MIQTIIFPVYFKLYLIKKKSLILFFLYNNITLSVTFNTKILRINTNLNLIQFLHCNFRSNFYNNINKFFFL